MATARQTSTARRRRGRARGFTLAEAVIAVTILGLMGMLIAGTFGRAIDAREYALGMTGHYHQVRQAMLRMTRELQMAYVSWHVNCEDPTMRTIFKTTGTSDGMRIDFTSFSHFRMHADANESDQNELSYYVGRHPNPPKDWDSRRSVLIRRESARVDENPEEGGVEQVLAEDVVGLEFEFYDAKEDRWENEWDSTSADFRDRLPMFVAVTLKVRGLDGKGTEEFTSKARIFVNKPLNRGMYNKPCD